MEKEEEAGGAALAARRKRMRGRCCLFLHPPKRRGRGLGTGDRSPPLSGAAQGGGDRPDPHQADEAEAPVPIDEDLAGLPVALEKALEILLGDISRQIPHEQPATLRVALLARFEKALDIDGEPNLLLHISATFFARRQSHGRRRLTLRF